MSPALSRHFVTLSNRRLASLINRVVFSSKSNRESKMLKSMTFVGVVAMILLLAMVAQRKTEKRRVKLPLNPRSRLTSDDTQ